MKKHLSYYSIYCADASMQDLQNYFLTTLPKGVRPLLLILSDNWFYFLCKVKQGQLVALRQIAEQTQISHQVDDCLADFCPLAEIVQGQIGAVF